MTRILAIGAYPFLTRDGAGRRRARQDRRRQQRRRHAPSGSGDRVRAPRRTTRGDIKVLEGLAQKYFDASAKKAKEADGKPKTGCRRRRQGVRQGQEEGSTSAKVGRAQGDQRQRRRPPRTSRPRPRPRRPRKTFKAAKKKHKDATAPYKQLEQRREGLQGLRAHVPDAHRAHRGRDPLQAGHRTATSNSAQARSPTRRRRTCRKYIKDIKDWTTDEKLGLVEGERRARDARDRQAGREGDRA